MSCRRPMPAVLLAVMLLPAALLAQLPPAGTQALYGRVYTVERVVTADSGIRQGVGQQAPSATPGSSVGHENARRMAPFADASAPTKADSLAFVPKSEFGAFMYSLLLAGGGQLYAGETKKGVTLMLMELGGAGLTVGSLASCENLLSGDCSDIPVVLGLTLALGSWIYSMADAPGAARRYNEKHARAQPIVDIEPRGGALVGVRVELGR